MALGDWINLSLPHQLQFSGPLWHFFVHWGNGQTLQRAKICKGHKPKPQSYPNLCWSSSHTFHHIFICVTGNRSHEPQQKRNIVSKKYTRNGIKPLPCLRAFLSQNLPSTIVRFQPASHLSSRNWPPIKSPDVQLPSDIFTTLHWAIRSPSKEK